jgi:sugar/nucleoside kinase (ribokinase family)
MRFANAAAALTTTELGAVSPIPRLKAVEDLMAQQPI